MHLQKALFLEKKDGKWFVADRSIPTVKAGELLIKIHSTALNPVDWKVRDYGTFAQGWPAVLGTDSAGTVEEIGEGVEGFEKGDRVVHQGFFRNDNATFQQYVICPAEVVAKIPPNLSFDQAASIPLGLTTAIVGLYLHRREKELEPIIPPWLPGGTKKYTDKTLVVIGGASSVGQYVIQLASLSGFSHIVATASPHNKEAVLNSGATHFVDRNEGAEAILRALGGRHASIVYDSISSPDTQELAWSVTASGGAMTIVLPKAIDTTKATDKTLVDGLFGSSYNPAYHDDCAIMYSHLTSLLAAGSIKPNRVETLHKGLNGIPDGLQRMKEGKVSMIKLIARPWETT